MKKTRLSLFYVPTKPVDPINDALIYAQALSKLDKSRLHTFYDCPECAAPLYSAWTPDGGEEFLVCPKCKTFFGFEVE